MRIDIWTAFQREILAQLGIDTLEEVSRVSLEPAQTTTTEVGTNVLQADDDAPVSNVNNVMPESTAQSQTSVETSPETKSETKSQTTMSVVEVGQREAWKTAIHAAHGCLITGMCELANDARVLIVTESPKLIVEADSEATQKAELAESEQSFADETLAAFTADMLASIGLVEVAFSRWQNALNYLPYERRDDAEPDLARFQTDFAELIATTSPSHVLAFGQLTAKLLLKSPAPIGKLRGMAHSLTIAERSLQAFALYHPAFLLRAPTHKRTQWQDLKLAYRSIHQREV